MIDLSFILLIGLGAGILSGLLGVGGGTIIIPALVLILGISQHVAQGIALAVIIPTAAVGAYSYKKRKLIDMSIGLPLAFGSVFGVVFGAIGASYVSDNILKKLFGLFMIVIAGTLLRKK